MLKIVWGKMKIALLSVIGTGDLWCLDQMSWHKYLKLFLCLTLQRWLYLRTKHSTNRDRGQRYLSFTTWGTGYGQGEVRKKAYKGLIEDTYVDRLLLGRVDMEVEYLEMGFLQTMFVKSEYSYLHIWLIEFLK